MSTIMRKMITVNRCERIYRAQEMNDEIPGFYHSYILFICKNPGMSQEVIAKELCFNKSSVTRHLSKLEKDGYVTRQVSEKDKRELLVLPTQKMLDTLPEVKKITNRWDNLIAESVSDEEMVIFREILDKITSRSLEIVYPED